MTHSINLEPLKRTYLFKEQIHKSLQEAIMEMDIYNADSDLRLEESKIAEQLGISRNPVREALIRLENEGLVEIKVDEGVFVKQRGIDEIAELIIVWAAIESMAARLACHQATLEEIEELRLIATNKGPDGTIVSQEVYSETNILFHRKILELSKCKMLQKYGEDVFSHIEPARRHAMRDHSRTEQSLFDHIQIVDAIQSGQGDRASKLVEEHTLDLEKYIRKTWKNHSKNDKKDK